MASHIGVVVLGGNKAGVVRFGAISKSFGVDQKGSETEIDRKEKGSVRNGADQK